MTAGYLVFDYEIWNLTLPTLTDKAAADFDPTKVPSGCRFHPRCPLVQSGAAQRLGIADRCRGEDPALPAGTHTAACHAVSV